jgi:hypothetical protein
MFYNIGPKSKVTEKKGFITLTNRVIVNVDRGKKEREKGKVIKNVLSNKRRNGEKE